MIEYVQEWPKVRARKSAPKARWTSIVGDFDGEVWPELQPSFRIRAGDTVFTIGSCFARNIEANLAALGCHVPMLSLNLPTEEIQGEARSAMNRFHPPAFRQCLEWTARIYDRDGKVTWADCEPMAFPNGSEPNETYFDMDMAAAVAVPKQRFIERRQQIYDVFATVFGAACLMMTPGFVETFLDKQTGLYIFGAPTNRAMLSKPERWRYETLTYEQCLNDMLAAIDVVRARNPEIKVLVTTSPVPLGLTFSGRDVRIANTYSKSVLRAVCDVVAASRPMVDYFPSYESVMLSATAVAWASDRLHVSQALIAKIVGRMTDTYLEGVEPAARQHQLAISAINEGDAAAALTAARQALAIDPTRSGAGVALLEALIGLEDWDEAEREALAMIEQDPARPEVLFRLARILGGQGRTEEAMAWILKGLDLPGVRQWELASVSKLIGRSPPSCALPVAQRGVERFPHQPESYAPLVGLLIAADRRAEALEVARRAVALAKPPLVLRMWLADLLIDTGELEQAQRALDVVLAAAPDHPYALKIGKRLRRQARSGA
jgi:Tfp pilus assembly protein PilF